MCGASGTYGMRHVAGGGATAPTVGTTVSAPDRSAPERTAAAVPVRLSARRAAVLHRAETGAARAAFGTAGEFDAGQQVADLLGRIARRVRLLGERVQHPGRLAPPMRGRQQVPDPAAERRRLTESGTRRRQVPARMPGRSRLFGGESRCGDRRSPTGVRCPDRSTVMDGRAVGVGQHEPAACVQGG
jgi:hypothetical protein